MHLFHVSISCFIFWKHNYMCHHVMHSPDLVYLIFCLNGSLPVAIYCWLCWFRLWWNMSAPCLIPAFHHQPCSYILFLSLLINCFNIQTVMLWYWQYHKGKYNSLFTHPMIQCNMSHFLLCCLWRVIFELACPVHQEINKSTNSMVSILNETD